MFSRFFWTIDESARLTSLKVDFVSNVLARRAFSRLLLARYEEIDQI
jgi:hypothetical protein